MQNEFRRAPISHLLHAPQQIKTTYGPTKALSVPSN